ncbi:MAG: hypothetical protein BWY47_02051 [Bacteroidetes bacterium ADurb.Bin302]|jgi:uncharacterized membrane protein|nr:MAG: hypothetical protein BWY47_02051 [Bacteroidetes bacterium ADurb.Bin302]
MVKQDWRYLLFLLLSHHPHERLHRTIHIQIKKKNVYLCARCTGTFIGIISIIIANVLGLKIPVSLYFPLIAILPLVATTDWFTQSAKLRESTNKIRIFSGFLLGISQGLILLSLLTGLYIIFLLALGAFALYIFSIYLIAAKTKCLDSYLNELTHSKSNSPIES